MPLEEGYSDAAASDNVRRMRREGKPPRQALAIALSKQREARRRRAMWRGGEAKPGDGRTDLDRQDQDVLVEEGNYRPKNTSGDPRTDDPKEMLDDSYADGGEVHRHVAHEHEVEDVTEKNKDRVADEHHARHMEKAQAKRGHFHEGGMYSDGGTVVEERKSFAAEPPMKRDGDIVEMAREYRKRRHY